MSNEQLSNQSAAAHYMNTDAYKKGQEAAARLETSGLTEDARLAQGIEERVEARLDGSGMRATKAQIESRFQTHLQEAATRLAEGPVISPLVTVEESAPEAQATREIGRRGILEARQKLEEARRRAAEAADNS